MKTAYATIKGFEVMRMFKKDQFTAWIEARRRNGGVLRQPAVRHLCVNRRCDQAFTRSDWILATEPEAVLFKMRYRYGQPATA
jgi:hypothetical protein